MVANQEIRKSHVPYAILNCRVIVVDAVRKVGSRPEVTIADIKIAKPLYVLVVVYTVVARLSFLESV
tara:strand:- start:980 stop:1180 length:201 start_codon:yes stop_codon:yes gene_type:complete